jgi:hypothetical protein
VLAFAAALLLGQAAIEPAAFVGKTVPETHSVVICPTGEAARRMLDDYYQPGTHILETARFFEGLAATGCTQEGGPVTVGSIQQGRTFDFAGGAQTHIRFEGRNAAGAAVHGIVDTDAFRVRTALESFLIENGAGDSGQVELQGGSYRCPSAEAARAVIRGVPREGDAAQRDARFSALVQAQSCAPATGLFRIRDVFESADFEGPDGAYTYQAVAGADDGGTEAGLLFLTAI